MEPLSAGASLVDSASGLRCVPSDCALRPIGQPMIVSGATKMMVAKAPSATSCLRTDGCNLGVGDVSLQAVHLARCLIRPISLENDGTGAVSPSGEPLSAVAICPASDGQVGRCRWGSYSQQEPTGDGYVHI
jgi:hypothetical protein